MNDDLRIGEDEALPAPAEPPPRQRAWTARTFELGLEPDLFPGLLERFRGTVARLNGLVSDVPRVARIWHPPQKDEASPRPWSMQEHAGHLLDLEELGERRLAAFLAGAEVLPPADMTNQRTYEANHDARAIREILQDFEHARNALVRKLERLGEKDLRRTALHPRLQRPMNIVEWVYFMCEHDDHHLARIRELQRDWAAVVRGMSEGTEV